MARIDLSSKTGDNTKRTGGFVSFAVALQEFRVLIYPTVSFTSETQDRHQTHFLACHLK